MNINIESIKIGKNRRPIDESKVIAIAESMKLIGQLSPVIINEDMELIAGAHRVEAAKRLGWPTIQGELANYDYIMINLANELGVTQRPEKCLKCDNDSDFTIEKKDKIYCWICQNCKELYSIDLPNINLISELFSIDENLMRNNLSKAEEGEYLLRRDEIIESFGSGEKIDINKDNLKVTSMSEKTQARRKDSVKGLDKEVLELVKGLDIANNQSELLKLVKLSKADQMGFINELSLGLVSSVDEYMARKKQRDLNNTYIPEINIADYNVSFDRIRDKSIDLIITQPPDIGTSDFIESILAACLPKIKVDGRCFMFIDPTPEVVYKYLDIFYSRGDNWKHLDLLNILVFHYKNFEHKTGIPYFADNARFVLHIAGETVENLNASGSSLNSVMEYKADMNDIGVLLPQGLVSKLIGIASKENDMILDPYMRDDCVLRNASAMGRRSVGFSEDLELAKFADRGYRIKTNQDVAVF